MVANSDLERQLKEALDEMQAQLDDLENTIREIERKIDESISQLKSLKSDI
ncbi:unknown [Coraliomargarita sp. CAG:312]|nr:unknown [Coraliomargarita sp. CAG:312]